MQSDVFLEKGIDKAMNEYNVKTWIIGKGITWHNKE